MKLKTIPLICASLAFFASSMACSAETLSEALQTGSSIKLNFRTRYENVEWDGLKDSDALTIRSRLTYQSGAWNGFAGTIEVDNISAVIDQDYRTWAKDPENPGTAIIGDRKGTDLNQSYISYTVNKDVIKYGRQRIILDNARFIGNSAWRQNEQTYDGVSITDQSLQDTTIFAAHITNVNRGAGNDVPIQGDYKQDTNLFNVGYSGFKAGKLSVFAYLINNLSDPYLVADAGNNRAAISNNTYGFRWASTANPKFTYALVFATQKSAYDNPIDYSADYKFVEVGTKIGVFQPSASYEILGSDDGKKGFATPLATLHSFKGWTDRFGTTPVNGLTDLNLSLASTYWNTQFLVQHHDFKSDIGSINYGSEWDLSVSKKIGAVVYLAKYAVFDNKGLVERIGTQNLASDTTKYWLQADWNF